MGIAFLGDVMLGRHMLPVLRQYSLKSLLEPIKALTQERHLVVNLESPFSRKQRFKENGSPSLCASLETVAQLSEAGITAVSLANNHIFDGGQEGLYETIQILDDWGIGHIGAGENLEKATRAYVIETDGCKVGIIAFSYTPPAQKNVPGVAYLYDETVENTIATVRPHVDFLVAMSHCGIELFQYPLPRDQNIYRKMIDFGVDLVIGGHSHCVQAMEVYHDRYIFYSLGDCVFDHFHQDVWEGFWEKSAHAHKFAIEATQDEPRHSLVVCVNFNEKQMKLSYHPVKTDDLSCPSPIIGDEYQNWMDQFNLLCSNLNSNTNIREKREHIQKILIESLHRRDSI